MEYPALWQAVLGAVIMLFTLFTTVGGSAALVFGMMRNTIKDQNERIKNLELRAAAAEKAAKDVAQEHDVFMHKLTNLAQHCPITNVPCPLSELFKPLRKIGVI